MEFTTTNLEDLKVDMLLKSSDGETKTAWTTGTVLTHGTPTGVKQDSSRSRWETLALMRQSLVANPTSLAPSSMSSSSDEEMMDIVYSANINS